MLDTDAVGVKTLLAGGHTSLVEPLTSSSPEPNLQQKAVEGVKGGGLYLLQQENRGFNSGP